MEKTRGNQSIGSKGQHQKQEQQYLEKMATKSFAVYL